MLGLKFNQVSKSGHRKRLLLTWFNFNPNAGKYNYAHYKVWDDIIYLFPNFKGTAVEVGEWISNFASLFTENVIVVNWDLITSISIK